MNAFPVPSAKTQGTIHLVALVKDKADFGGIPQNYRITLYRRNPAALDLAVFGILLEFVVAAKCIRTTFSSLQFLISVEAFSDPVAFLQMHNDDTYD